MKHTFVSSNGNQIPFFLSILQVYFTAVNHDIGIEIKQLQINLTIIPLTKRCPVWLIGMELVAYIYATWCYNKHIFCEMDSYFKPALFDTKIMFLLNKYNLYYKKMIITCINFNSKERPWKGPNKLQVYIFCKIKNCSELCW